MRPEFRTWRMLAILAMLVALLVPGTIASGKTTDAPKAAPSSAGKTIKYSPEKFANARPSQIWDVRKAGTLPKDYRTDCPQAGVEDHQAPADRIEAISDDGDDVRVNQDLLCQPQNETSVDFNPRNPNNIVAGANDYRLGFGTSGFYNSFDGGKTWKDGIIPFPSLPNGDNLDGGGDPAIAFDRDGYVYYAEINFNRTDDTNGVFVSRSSNGGQSWSRMCVPVNGSDPDDNVARCGGPGDNRKPGDGVVAFQFDNNNVADGSINFNDKEYLAAGPRPAGVAAQCFGPEVRTPVRCRPEDIGPDRLHVTFTAFTPAANPFGFTSRILASYSDDRAKSWSPLRVIAGSDGSTSGSGSAPFCIGFTVGDNRCNFNQFSVPTVHPRTGALYVAFQNFNTEDENQYLVVRSINGGQTFSQPRFVGSVFDVNYPFSFTDIPGGFFGERPDCQRRGQSNGRDVLTNSCFRVNSAGNIVVDKRGGSFADDLYVVISDNREGTPRKSNTNIYMFKSTNGGNNWTQPTRVNSDFSRLTGSRDDPNNAQVQGNDQYFPWIDTNMSGDLNVLWSDRRLDRDSVEHEHRQVSRQFPGNYLVWTFVGQCQLGAATGQTGNANGQCVVNTTPQPQPTGPVNPGPGRVEPQGQTRFPFRNIALSDVPSNWDYTFRAGIFAGDYNNVAVEGSRAFGFWTDARNGRSSRTREGFRNPNCEQSDVFGENYAARGAASDQNLTGSRPATDRLFLKAYCPGKQS